MSEEEIRYELNHLRTELVDMKETLQEVRDKVISTPICPQPGLCLQLSKTAYDTEQRMRALERRDAYILGACGVISFAVPLLMKFVFKL
jgi:hypothetical protein